MRGLIWYSERSSGLYQFKQICNEYKRLNIACTRSYENSAQIFAEFANGDSWQAVPAIDQSRGRACNVAYIDKRISEDVVNKVIKPCLKIPPYRAYYYY